MMVNFMCQLNWVMEYTDIWSNIIDDDDDDSVKVFTDETDI